MTGTDIFDTALVLMNEDTTSKADYPGFLTLLNLFLMENYDINNGLRLAAVKLELVEVPWLTTLTDAVGYEPVMERVILPYGLAGRLVIEDNASLAAQFTNKYEYEREKAIRARFENPVEDEEDD